jgi:hypothetical protein
MEGPGIIQYMRKYPLLMAMTFQLKMFTVVDSIEANFASPLFYSVFSIVVLLRPTLILCSTNLTANCQYYLVSSRTQKVLKIAVSQNF